MSFLINSINYNILEKYLRENIYCSHHVSMHMPPGFGLYSWLGTNESDHSIPY
jgi:hypothetical protein